MNDTCCGKSCTTCARRTELCCGGCKGYAYEIPSNCEICKCCAAKGHESCGTCSFREGCATLRQSQEMPDLALRRVDDARKLERYREEQAVQEAQAAQTAREERDEARQQRLRTRAAIAAKWLWPLFWLIIPNLIASFLTAGPMPIDPALTAGELLPMDPAAIIEQQEQAASTILTEDPSQLDPSILLGGQAQPNTPMTIIGQIIGLCYNLAYGLFLLRMSVLSPRYRIAGSCCLAAVPVALLTLLVPNDASQGTFTILMLVMIAAMVLSLILEVQESMANAELLDDFDPAQAEKWRRRVRLFLYATGGIFMGAFLSAMFPALGLMLLLASAITLIVVGIQKLIYLYIAAVFFRRYIRDNP